MSWFWIVGIVLNVGLTVAAIVWVIRQGKRSNDAAKDDEDAST
jgi:heme/copper-type cytochrome/quinol oxidase subunit 4